MLLLALSERELSAKIDSKSLEFTELLNKHTISSSAVSLPISWLAHI